jgi:hypothetical protein
VDTVVEEERRRRLRSVVAVVEPSSYNSATTTTGWTGSQRRGPGGGSDGRANGEATAWTRRCRRRQGKIWQPDNVQVKILQLGFKDRVAGVFIQGPQ